MRILVVTSTFPRWQGDTEPAFVLELCRRLKQSGINVDVVAPHAPGAKRAAVMEDIYVSRFRYGPERLETLAYSGGILANLRQHKIRWLLVPSFLFMQVVAVWRQSRKINYDLIHAHWLFPQGLLCVLSARLIGIRRRIPVVCTAHGSDLYALQGGIFEMFRKFTMQGLTHLCVVSRPMRDDCLAEGAAADRLSVLPMGVDLNRTFIPAVNVTRKVNRIIFVGRFVAMKGIMPLIEAVAAVSKTIPTIELVLAGSGPLLPAINQEISRLGIEHNVNLIGSIANSDLPSWYSSAAVAVFPSIAQEGFGLTLVEAMGCGCAVIASDLPAIREIVQHGENGLLARPGDGADLADKILQLLRDQPMRERLAAHGRECVRARFDWETAASGYYQLFHHLLAEEPGSN